MPLPKEEWFFGRLEDHQIESCWVYEFCRASEVILQLHERDMALLENNEANLLPFGMLISDFRGFSPDGFWWLRLDEEIRLHAKAGFPTLPYQLELKKPPKIERQAIKLSDAELSAWLEQYAWKSVRVRLGSPKNKPGPKPEIKTIQTYSADLKALGALRLRKHLSIDDCIAYARDRNLSFYAAVDAVSKAVARARKIVKRFDDLGLKQLS